MVSERRAPNTNAAIGTPEGSSHDGSIDGHCWAGAVKRALGCAALRPQSGVQSLPCQSMSLAGASLVRSSHQTSPSGVRATLVKIAFSLMVATALGLDSGEVPGA